MTNKRHRTGSVMTVAVGVCLTFLTGCAHDDPASLEMFLTDLLRSAAAALLL